MKDSAYSILNNYDQTKKSNLTTEEQTSLKNLSSRSDIIVADKGNTIVIVDKKFYIERMISILNHQTKFQEVNVEKGKDLNKIIGQERKINNV